LNRQQLIIVLFSTHPTFAQMVKSQFLDDAE
jgi:hypothetical protein